ncbi:MAG TPA: metallophosphoesterase, partial [Desulfobacteria bacterium]|nr:metallophosphoesterase [Desulfobacteria bacterium]
MRNPVFIVVFGLIVILFALLNYYIGLRGWQTIGSYFRFNRRLYWVFFWCLTFTYIAARIVENFLPAEISRSLVLIGSNWLGLMYYFILVIALVDILRLLGKITGLIPKAISDNPFAAPVTGIAVLLVVMGIWGYGLWNAYHPQVTQYNIKINKPASAVKKLHIVMISDIHLGSLVGSERLQDMVNRINVLNPDVVLFAGDTIDEDINYFKEKKMGSHFTKIKSKYGVFAVLGNHEYIGQYADEAVRELNKAGVRVLKDDYVKV